MPGQWHAMTEAEILEYFKTDLKNGLSEQEAGERLSRFGPNQLVRKTKASLSQLFFKQLASIGAPALLVALAITIIGLEYNDALALTAVAATAAILGGIQEYRAKRYINAIKQISMPTAKVRRGGHERKVPAADLVPGDIVLLTEGDLVPADLRLLLTEQLEVDESAFGGESVPVRKTKDVLAGEEPALKDNLNLAYMNTVIVKGQGGGVVVHTGMATAIGYASGVGTSDERYQIPIKHCLELFYKVMSTFCFFTCAAILATLTVKGEEFREICLAGLSLAAAAIPAGLPSLVTVALAAGAKRMSKHGAVIRKLTAVTNLAYTTVICSNKIETFTKNEKIVRKVVVGGRILEVTGAGYDPKGDFTGDKHDLNFNLLVKAAALCNNAVLKRGSINITGLFRGLTGGRTSGRWSVKGDSTEGALLVMAVKAGFWRERLELHEQRVAELPFDPERKRMTVVYRDPSGAMSAYVKGAPEVLLERCTHVYINGKIAPLSAREKGNIMASSTSMAKEAFRVLAFAYKQIPDNAGDISAEIAEQQLIFLGLAGMLDPVKPAVLKAVQTCRRAAIKVMLLTGEQRYTAHALAAEIGIITKEENILTGSGLDRMSNEQLLAYLNQVSVCARVTPRQKLRIIKALKQLGQVVAVTGSEPEEAGTVNEADIGIAIGYSGNEKTREISDIFLGEDHFGSIAALIEEGRGIYHNVRQSMRVLLSCNIGEIFSIFFALLMGLPVPLLPVQILWVNFIGNGLPSMTLGMNPNPPGLMLQPPRRLWDSILGRKLIWRFVSDGAVISMSILAAFFTGFCLGDTSLARTMAFHALAFSQLFFILNCHNESQAVSRGGVFINPYLTGTVLISCVLQAAINYVPFLQLYFHVVHLNVWQWVCVLLVSVLPSAIGTLFRHIAGKFEKKMMYLRVRLG